MALHKKSFNEELAAEWLGAVIRREISKPDDEADMDLVEECEKALESLSLSSAYSDEELNEKLKQIMSMDRDRSVVPPKRRLRGIRRAAVIAACLALVLIGGVITSYAFVPSIWNYISQVLNLPYGSSVDFEGITVNWLGESRQYATLDEMVAAEGLEGVFLPHLDGDLRISEVYITEKNDQKEISIIFTDDSILMNIEIDTGIDLSELSVTSEKKEINGIVSYISESDGICASVTVCEGRVYYVTSDDREKVITILESLFK